MLEHGHAAHQAQDDSETSETGGATSSLNGVQLLRYLQCRYGGRLDVTRTGDLEPLKTKVNHVACWLDMFSRLGRHRALW